MLGIQVVLLIELFGVSAETLQNHLFKGEYILLAQVYSRIIH